MHRIARSHPTRQGYTLATYPDCTERHRGQWQGTTIYVVGRHTDSERLFRRDQLTEAAEWARENKVTIEALATADLCDQAVIDTYSPAAAQ